MPTDEPLSPVVMQSRLIAFLDILGFSRLLEAKPLVELHQDYAALIDEARNTVFGASPAEGTNFAKAQFVFDSVVLVSHPLDEGRGPNSAFGFLSAVSHLMRQTFARRMPLRGAVGLGDFLDDPARDIFLSPIFPSLVRAEREQDWCGVMVLDDAIGEIFEHLHGARPEEVPLSPANLLIQYDVPRKATALGGEPGWCVNWVWLTDAPHLAEPLSWIVEPKRSAVLAFANHIQSLSSPSFHLALPQPVGAVVAARFQVARAGMNLKFLDAEGRGADPPAGTIIQLQFAEGVTHPAVAG